MSDEPKTLKDSIETLNYLLTQVIVELKQLNSTLMDMTFLQANKRLIQKEQKTEEKKEFFKGDKAALERYLKQKCPTVWANLDEVRQMKSGDFLVTFDYMSSEDFSKAAKEIKEHLNGYYSKKYRGFIIPGAGGGRE